MIRLKLSELSLAELDALERLAAAMKVAPPATQITRAQRRAALIGAIQEGERSLARAPSNTELRALIAQRAAARRQGATS